MGSVVIAMQVIVGLGILNVWLLRRNKATPFRGGKTSSMTEEFAHYGLPAWSVPVVGASKVILALCILVGLFIPSLIPVGAFGLGLFMLGAVAMHIKERDSLMQTAPSLVMLLMCAFLVVSTGPGLVAVAGL